MHLLLKWELESSRCFEDLSSAMDPSPTLALASQPYREKCKNLQWSGLAPAWGSEA